MARRSLCLALALTLAVRPALADDTPPPETARTSTAAASDEAPPAGRRALAAGAAIGPGAVVHGLGHFVRGDPATGRTLLLLEGVGLGAMGGGLVTLFVTGASRKVVVPAATLTLAGAGLFVTSYLADIYGAARGESLGSAATTAPLLVTEVGVRKVVDPTFSYGAFFVQAADLTLGRVRIRPEGWHALDAKNERLRALVAVRFVGPRPASSSATDGARDGSFVDLELAATHHAYLPERFRISTGELAVRGRYDGARFARSLAGSFVEGSLGIAVASYAYDVSGDPIDVNEHLLGGFAYGVYLGRGGSAPAGEVSLYYDHRHDGFTAGAKIPGVGSGVPGHVGLRGVGYFSRSFGVRAEVEAGSALLGGASLLFRVDP